MLTFTLQPPKAVVRLHLHTLLPWTPPAIVPGFGMPWAPGPEACHALRLSPGPTAPAYTQAPSRLTPVTSSLCRFSSRSPPPTPYSRTRLAPP